MKHPLKKTLLVTAAVTAALRSQFPAVQVLILILGRDRKILHPH